jgi:protein-S-isoprenylcysteine O-methyltransferase Ste14
LPTAGVLVLVVVSLAVILGAAAWGWGGWAALVAHPARAWACAIVVIATVVALFTGLNLGGCRRADSRGRWLLAPFTGISLAMLALPPYLDRRGIGTIDGGAVRYLGLALLMVGCVLRVGPMFVLEDRFTWPLASQVNHRLETGGFYRYIRHPSYLGALLGGIGWVLVFRSGIGLILMLLLIPLFLGIVREEEALLLAEFGEQYADYRRRTWRLIPFVY